MNSEKLKKHYLYPMDNIELIFERGFQLLKKGDIAYFFSSINNNKISLKPILRKVTIDSNTRFFHSLIKMKITNTFYNQIFPEIEAALIYDCNKVLSTSAKHPACFYFSFDPNVKFCRQEYTPSLVKNQRQEELAELLNQKLVLPKFQIGQEVRVFDEGSSDSLIGKITNIKIHDNDFHSIYRNQGRCQYIL